MTRSAKQIMIIAAAQMMRSETGRSFAKAFELYVEESRENLVFAPLANLEYAQGVARQGTVLLKLLQTAEEETVKILAAEEAAQQRTQK